MIDEICRNVEFEDANKEDVLREEDYKDDKILIFPDPDAESPRLWDNLGKMVCFHGRYQLGDDHEFRNVEEFIEFVEGERNNLLILPLYLYDHSGITMSTTPFSCPWDSGKVGEIYCTREQADEKVGADKTDEEVLDILKQEVSVYDSFLKGGFVGFVISSTGESGWGYESIDKCLFEARVCIDTYRNE